MFIMQLHRTQGTLFILLVAKLERMKHLVSSLPMLHSSSILWGTS